jgi:hypothetical protein
MLQVPLSILVVRFAGSGTCCTVVNDNQHCHLTAASIWGIMALRLADEEIIPLSYMSYTTELEVHCPLSATTFGGRGSQRNEDRSKTYELDISFFSGVHKNSREGNQGDACQLFPIVQLNQSSKSGSYQSRQ